MPRTRIDSKKIAKALGADTVIRNQKQAKNGQYYVEFFSGTKGSRTIKRRIYRLDEKNKKEYALLGIADGIDFWHCFLISMQNVKSFQNRVYGYDIERSCLPGCSFAISFYAKK